MKRTQLRRTKPSARGCKAKPGKSCAKRNQSLELRRDYHREFPGDEYDSVLKVTPRLPGTPPPKWWETQTHHLFTNPRVDVWCNFITLSVRSHLWAHAHLDANRVLSMLVKHMKGEDSLETWGTLAGSKDSTRDIAGWVSTLHFDGELAWVEPYRLRLMEELERLKGGAA